MIKSFALPTIEPSITTKATKDGKNLEFIISKNEEGFDVFCFLVIEAEEHNELAEKIEKGTVVDLEKQGKVLASGYGTEPHGQIISDTMLKFKDGDYS